MVQALRQSLQAQGGAVELVETHLSRLLLTPGWAYKLKKPVQLPFADFRDLAARRHFCEEELRLNQRLAPALYVDVLPVLGTAQAPRLGAPGEAGAAIDWALRMRRFPAGSEFDALARAGALQPREIDAFAARIAHFHTHAPQAPDGSDWGTAPQVARAISDVFDTLAPLLSRADAQRLARLRAWFFGAQALAPRWAARRDGGHVREGHGDLHLGNVVRLEEGPTAFDCIEFSPALRWTDTLADAGFFTMDLHAHGHPALAWRFLDGYLAATGDYAGLAVLRPYEVYRALVRAMAARLRAAQGAAPQAGPDYLACAEALAAPMQPRLLITHGLSGSGKSTVAAALLEAAGAVRLRSDVERKRLHGLPALADSAACGAAIYTPEATERTFAHLAALARTALLAGYPVIVDAAFLRRRERDAFHALARELAVPFAILHCHAAEGQLRERVQQRRAAGSDPSEADLAVLARQQESAEPLSPAERALALDVDTGAAWSAPALHRHWLDFHQHAGRHQWHAEPMNTVATPLTDSQRDQLRALLEQRKEQLLAELGEIQRDTLAVATGLSDAGAPDDRKDQADRMAQSAVRDAEATRDHDELVAVRAALERLAEGSYGECTDCGQPVGAARLLAQPSAARCIACQSQAEARPAR